MPGGQVEHGGGVGQDDARPSSGESNGQSRDRHACYICARTYERHDHLSRHLKSHGNERQHRCDDCGKVSDLLNRHRTAHAKARNGEAPRKRTGRACKSCIAAKTKCEDERPCKRCCTREIDCEDADAPPDSGDGSLVTPSPKQYTQTLQTSDSLGASTATWPDFLDNANFPNLSNFNHPSMDVQGVNMLMDDFAFPDFFEQIMTTDVSNIDTQNPIVMPPDVSDFTRDLDFSTGDIDFSMLGMDLMGAASAAPPIDPPTHHHAISKSSKTMQSDAQLRSEAFERSPWSWNHWNVPRNQHAFSGQEEINAPDDNVSPADQLTPCTYNQKLYAGIDHKDRDRMMKSVMQIALNRISIPSFPSLQLLEDLIDVYLLQETNSTCARIHTPSLNSRSTKAALLLAMVAAGAGFIAHEPIWKMGLVLQEVVRLAITDSVELNNSLTRDLQTLQAYMLFLDIGAWSGWRRKVEIASSFAQPIHCMLTWSRTLDTQRYKDIVPAPQDDDQTLESKWKAWAEQEGFKRLSLHLFLHDAQISFIQMRNPLMSCAQMLLPVPTERDLWLAPDAHIWRERFLSKNRPSQAEMPCVLDIFVDLSVLDQYESILDKKLCSLAACYALAHDVWDFRQQSALLQRRSRTGLRDRRYNQMNWQRDLLDDLHAMRTYCEFQCKSSQEMMFSIEFLMMSLHVSLDDIQIFSGRAGEEQARKLYPKIRDWSESVEARTAVSHAGSVFRIARAFEKTQLRDFYAIAMYNAALVLWIYGMVTSKTRRSGVPTPNRMMPGAGSKQSTPMTRQPVFLDTGDEKATQAFRLLNSGVPGLRSYFDHSYEPNQRPGSSPPGFCALYNARGVICVAADVLTSNFPRRSNGLPPLVENLVNLLQDLGKLSES